MNTTSTDTVQKVLLSLEEGIRAISARLEANILVGEPYLLTMQDKLGNTRVYGHWMRAESDKAVPGWMSSELVPDHLCGTVQFTPESARKNIEHFAAKGLKVEKLFTRDFLTSRLAELYRMHTALSPLGGLLKEPQSGCDLRNGLTSTHWSTF